MEGYGPETYGDRWADVYDEYFAGFFGESREATLAVLAELARGGPVLELAVGTGRLAIPLAARGLAVHGIDASEAMVAKLRAKPGGDAIGVTIGDFADVAVDGSFPLVFVAFNTFYALTTQDDQVRCFENVAAHLTDDGVFVVEGFVPDVARFDRGQRAHVVKVTPERVVLDLTRHDPVTQSVASQHVVITSDGIRLLPIALRYAWPSELDLMARLAGLRLRERWGGWNREPYTAESIRHVSVYEKG